LDHQRKGYRNEIHQQRKGRTATEDAGGAARDSAVEAIDKTAAGWHGAAGN